MDEVTLLDALQRYWDYAATDSEIAHEIYHDDAVLEFPQSQERFEGKANFMAWRKIYPASVESKIRRLRGRGDFWIVEISIRYGGVWNYGCSILEFRGVQSSPRNDLLRRRMDGSRLACCLACRVER